MVVSFAGAEPAELGARESEAAAVKEQIAVLNAELEAKIESYNFANYELERIKASIAENEAKLVETAAVLNDTQVRLDKRMTNIYKNGKTDFIDVLMDTTDISDFLTKYDMMTKVGEQDKSDVEQVKLLKQQIETAQTQLAADQAAQSEILAQVEAEKGEIEAGVAERQQMLAGIEDEIAAMREQEAAEQAQLRTQVVTSGGGGGGGGDIPISTAGGAVGIAMQYLGVPYVWGGESGSGVDCSGLVKVVYGALGYSLPHSAAAQYGYGTHVSYDQLAPGDLVFFGYGSGISHVGIYIGGGNMIHAPFEGEVVKIAPVNYGGSYVGATRL
ncbi:MAG: C40 family peptidase [Thermoleophilia bacterium]